MNNKKLIAFARTHLDNGNLFAYKRLMRSNIQSAMSERSKKAFQDAMAEDAPKIKAIELLFLK